MRKKRFMSVVLASALVATMAVPAMADSGTVPVDVGDKEAVLRVQLPTKLTVDVDPLEMMDEGSQIYSQEFQMTNKSEVPVKVSVNSVATKVSGVKVVASKLGASANASSVWLAAAAQTNYGVYDDVRTVSPAETIKTLSDGNSNVATFSGTDAGTTASASQNFYLNRSGDPDGDPIIYSMLSGNDKEYKEMYTQIYELEELTAISNNDDLQVSVNETDVYTVLSENVSTNEKIKDAHPTKILRNATCVSGDATQNGYVSENKYYKLGAKQPVTNGAVTLVAGKYYLHGETTGNGDVAAFRYIGCLSDKPGDDWSSAKIPSIAINYDIKGVKGTTYTERQPYCVYGLEGSTSVNAAGPKVTLNSDTVRITGLPEGVDLDWDEPVMLVASATEQVDLNNETDLEWVNGTGEYTIKLGSSWIDWLGGRNVTVTATLTDGSTISTQGILGN